MDENNIPYQLIAKYLSNQCTHTEKEHMDRWIKEDPQHSLLLEKLQKQWQAIQIDTSAFVIPDKTQVWGKIQNQIHHHVKQNQLYSKQLLIRISSIAAVIAFLFASSLFYLFYKPANNLQAELLQNVIIAPPGQKTQLVLPDGTLVWLNSGSRLSYNYQYNTHGRSVKLEGEAFFDVKKDNQYPFIVKTDLVDIKVHGTAFNVSAYKDDKDITVALLRGKVSLLADSNQELLTYLVPNQMATVSKHDLSCQVEVCDAEVEASWHHNLLKFEGEPARKVWKKLERWYGVDITLSNVNPSQVYWFTLKTESLTELLEMINRITPIKYELKGKEVIIGYK